MSKKDKFHDALKNALLKDGWKITDDPLQIKMGTLDGFIDLGAERLLIAVKGEEKIAVEIKSFLRASNIYEFYTAFGQFLSYREALAVQDSDRMLFLAIPESVYESFFKTDFITALLQKFQVKLITYDSEKEEILRWIK